LQRGTANKAAPAWIGFVARKMLAAKLQKAQKVKMYLARSAQKILLSAHRIYCGKRSLLWKLRRTMDSAIPPRMPRT
jgi:hypothetical protein